MPLTYKIELTITPAERPYYDEALRELEAIWERHNTITPHLELWDAAARGMAAWHARKVVQAAKRGSDSA